MGTRAYEAEGIVVRFDLKRCIHAEECVHGLPMVFDAKRRPWIDPSQAGAAEVAAVVEQCPSGALTYERKDGGAAEVVIDPPEITAVRDGPLYVRGRHTLCDHEGQTVDGGPRVALCRCGHSKNKPYCDNSHIEAGFTDAAE